MTFGAIWTEFGDICGEGCLGDTCWGGKYDGGDLYGGGGGGS